MKPVLTIVGGGMGETALLTAAARREIEKAERLFAPARIADAISDINPAARTSTTEGIQRALQEKMADATVVVSGDVCFFSLSDTLTRAVGIEYEIRHINGISSLQYLCGKVGVPYQDVKVLSLHGRSGSITAAASYNRRVFVLTGGECTVTKLASELAEAGLGHIVVTVGENLSAIDERIVRGTARFIANEDFPNIAVMLLENPSPADPSRRLCDDDFVRAKTPMTKEAVRVVSVARLDVRPTDTVWDIGAGTGSVSVALAYAAREGLVCAVERDSMALALIRENMARLGAHNICVTEAEAPNGLDDLPDPDRVFIGGSGGNMRSILARTIAREKPFTVCINAITLESVAAALDNLESLGFSDIEASCVNVSSARDAGGYHLMTAQNPVHIISGVYRP